MHDYHKNDQGQIAHSKNIQTVLDITFKKI